MRVFITTYFSNDDPPSPEEIVQGASTRLYKTVKLCKDKLRHLVKYGYETKVEYYEGVVFVTAHKQDDEWQEKDEGFVIEPMGVV